LPVNVRGEGVDRKLPWQELAKNRKTLVGSSSGRVITAVPAIAFVLSLFAKLDTLASHPAPKVPLAAGRNGSVSELAKKFA
jgi:hypothetical protein